MPFIHTPPSPTNTRVGHPIFDFVYGFLIFPRFRTVLNPNGTDLYMPDTKFYNIFMIFSFFNDLGPFQIQKI